jgi:hypothetical protein
MNAVTQPSGPVLTAEDMVTIRAFHRGTRNAGYVFCLVGVLVMVGGRYLPGAPVWLTSVGLAVVMFGWGLLAYALFKRVALVRSIASRRGG